MSVSPRVSILIPNFNNGKASSTSGERDLIGDLLESLKATLSDDPTPVEIIVVDDGSTDDSLETVRAWSRKTWTQGGRDEHPFCRLIELEHTGVLSLVANRLMEESSGDICCRLDGDIVIHTNHWATRLCELFAAHPDDIGVIGPKQLAADGRVHSAGDWLFHPRGYTHIAQGASATDVNEPMEVDHVMGCFYCMRRSVWDDVGPYDPTILRGQTIDYTVRARLNGWRVYFTPAIEFTHYHSERCVRKNSADTGKGVGDTIARFEEKWGFDRLTPDLDAIRSKYNGTPLLWNDRIWIKPTPSNTDEALTLENSRWVAYQSDPMIQRQIDDQALIVARTAELEPERRRIVQFGCSDGMLVHFLAQASFQAVGVDADPRAIELARAVTSRSTYPDGCAPTFELMHGNGTTGLPDDSADILVAFGVLEHHHNPMGMLKEAHRILRPEGKLVIYSKARTSPLDDIHSPLNLFAVDDLESYLKRSGLFGIIPSTAGIPDDMLLVIASNLEGFGRTFVSSRDSLTPENAGVV